MSAVSAVVAPRYFCISAQQELADKTDPRSCLLSWTACLTHRRFGLSFEWRIVGPIKIPCMLYLPTLRISDWTVTNGRVFMNLYGCVYGVLVLKMTPGL